MVFGNKDKLIIVAGEWKPSNLGYDYFETSIYSDKQIFILNWYIINYYEIISSSG